MSYFYWHIFGNQDICTHFLRERDIHFIKINENGTETQTIKTFWRWVKNKYSIKSWRASNLFEYHMKKNGDSQFDKNMFTHYC